MTFSFSRVGVMSKRMNFALKQKFHVENFISDLFNYAWELSFCVGEKRKTRNKKKKHKSHCIKEAFS